MTAFELQLQITLVHHVMHENSFPVKSTPDGSTSFNYLRLLTTRNEENWGWHFFYAFHCHNIAFLEDEKLCFLISYICMTFVSFIIESFGTKSCKHKKDFHIETDSKSSNFMCLNENTMPMSIDTLIPSFVNLPSHNYSVRMFLLCAIISHNVLCGGRDSCVWSRRLSFQQLNGHCWWVTIKPKVLCL